MGLLWMQAQILLRLLLLLLRQWRGELEAGLRRHVVQARLHGEDATSAETLVGRHHATHHLLLLLQLLLKSIDVLL